MRLNAWRSASLAPTRNSSYSTGSKTLLYHFDAEHLLFSRFEVKVGEDGLEGAAWGEPMDPARHELNHEVKAITYHGLKVEQTADGWLAEVIVDI